MNVLKIPLTTEDKLPAYAWPGGYTMIYYTDDGTVLCADCATDGLRQWCDADWRGPANVGLDDRVWYDGPTQGDLYDEGPLETCENCGRTIYSSYGDPDEPEPKGD